MSENEIKYGKNGIDVNSFSEIFELINKINKKYTKLQRQIVSESNLTPPQYSILQTLWKSDGVPFKDLATACCCSQSTITGIIDTMEKNNLVTREMNPNDRRSILVKLTEKGKKLEELTPPIIIATKSCCSGFEAEETNYLNFLLKKLFNSFEISELSKC